MTQEEIIRMALESGFSYEPSTNNIVAVDGYSECRVRAGLERFAALVAAHEREKQAEQEPVGVVEGSGEWGIAGVLVAGVPIGTKLYAAPVRTKDLTDDEIDALIDRAWDKQMSMPEIIRAVIAADREKNK